MKIGVLHMIRPLSAMNFVNAGDMDSAKKIFDFIKKPSVLTAVDC